MTFDLESTRRDLIAMRVKYGAKSAIGYRCSNIVQQMEEHAKAKSEEQRLAIEANIRAQVADLRRLTSAPNAEDRGSL